MITSLVTSGNRRECNPALDCAGVVVCDAPPRLAAFEVGAGAWWVLHTRSRHEKAVAAALERQRVPYFLPLARQERSYGGRRVWAEIPLFPGYMFVRGGSRECEAAWRTNRIANVLRVADQGRMDRELRQILQVVDSGVAVDLYPGLRAGSACRITRGSLAGIEGVVIRRKGVSRVYVAVTFVGQSAVVEIDTADVEVIA